MFRPADDVTSVLRPLLLACTPFGVGLRDADAGSPRRLFRCAASLLVVGVAVAEVVFYLRLALLSAPLNGQQVSHAVAIFLTGVSSCACTGVHLLDRSSDVMGSFRRATASDGQDFRRARRCVVATLVAVLAYGTTLVSLRLGESSDVSYVASVFLHVVDDLTVLQFSVLVTLLWDQHRRLNRALLETFQRRDVKVIQEERVVCVRRRHAELTALSGEVLGVFGPAVVAVVVKTTLSVVAVIYEAIARLAKRKTSPFATSTVVTVIRSSVQKFSITVTIPIP